MTTKGMYKLDNGNCRPTNCFPARSLLQPRYAEGAGHWQVARQTAEKTKIELLLGAKATRIKWRGLPLPTDTQRHMHEKILDGVQLMTLHHVRSPSHLCSVDISNQNFASAKEEDFEQFDSVAYINATENLLTLEGFRTFPGLRELELSLNGLRNLKVSAGDFPHLEVLDLSYNNLSPEDVQALGILSHLKVLHLTANGLHSLPLDLADPDSEGHLRFSALEVLLLDDNYLSHPNIFVSLANLQSLKQLNLDKNGIKEVPYLHYGNNSHFSIHPLSAKSGIREGLRSRKSAGKQFHQNRSPGLDKQPDYIILPNSKDRERTEIIFPSPDPITQENSPSPSVALHCKMSTSFNQEFILPLPELRFLSLANNQIEHEEDLLAVALFPSLTELTFHGNPFTISRSGDPPLLSSFLQNKLGITLVRKKICKLEKPRIFIPVKANRKVKSQLPKIQKRPLMLEPPQEATFWELWTGAEVDPDNDLPEPVPPTRLPAGEQNEAECLLTAPQQNLFGTSPLSEPPPEEQDSLRPVPPSTSTCQEPKPPEHEPLISSSSVPRESSYPRSPASASPMSQSVESSEPLATFTASGKTSGKLLRLHSSSRDLYLLLSQAGQSLLEASEECSSDVELFSSSSEESLESRKSESFFMTQVVEPSSSQFRKETTTLQQPSEVKIVEPQQVPEKYKGYEELLDSHTDKDPDFIEPVGIQQNVKALKKALQYPLVYRDSKARLDSLQKRFIPVEKKVLRVPPPQPRQTKEQKLEEILHKMRTPTNILEVPLVCILRRRKSNWREYREALALLKEFQQEYKTTVAACGMGSESRITGKAGTSQSRTLRGLAGIKASQQQRKESPQITKEDKGL
ncbi:X-ray radiation resistance-associated protein 1 [Tiliqua scincoides]|uniref:X-ray radiation resistance-associated protein 1 n=1 Tax=Tiliqua scincoides TaxID=71010 RepID=UPI003461CFB2